MAVLSVDLNSMCGPSNALFALCAHCSHVASTRGRPQVLRQGHGPKCLWLLPSSSLGGLSSGIGTRAALDEEPNETHQPAGAFFVTGKALTWPPATGQNKAELMTATVP